MMFECLIPPVIIASLHRPAELNLIFQSQAGVEIISIFSSHPESDVEREVEIYYLGLTPQILQATAVA